MKIVRTMRMLNAKTREIVTNKRESWNTSEFPAFNVSVRVSYGQRDTRARITSCVLGYQSLRSLIIFIGQPYTLSKINGRIHYIIVKRNYDVIVPVRDSVCLIL